MKKLFTATLTIILLVCTVTFFSNVSAATTVGGLITTDTVWSQGNTYKLVGSVGIAKGATLTIEPGVIVDLASHYIQVNGTLNARGTSSKNVVFTGSYSFGVDALFPQNSINFMDSSTDWENQSASGCIIQNALLKNVGTIVTGSSPKLSQNTYNYSGMTISSGSPTVTNNEFLGAGVRAYDSATISNNYFKGSGVTACGTAFISNNVIDQCTQGTTLWAEVTFTENTVTNCQVGIESDASTVTLRDNYICNCKYGIKGGGIIESNTIINNTVGLQLSQSSYLTSITLKNNNIYNNSQSNLVMSRSTDLDATNNYWGTTNNQAIGQTIQDATEDFSLGKVNYSPCLTSSSSSAPVVAGKTEAWTFDWAPSFDYQTVILQVAEIVAVALAIGWIIALTVIMVRRRRLRQK